MFLEKLKKDELWIILATMATSGVVLFWKLLDNYIDKEGLSGLDVPVNNMMVTLRTPVISKIMLLITLTGNWQMLLWGTVLASILLLAANKYRYFLAMVISNVSGFIFTEGAKLIISRPRPPIANALIKENGYAFPSGHSYFAVVFYGLIFYFWYKHFHKWPQKIAVAVGGIGFILLLAFSRIYLGVHWTTDVLAGLSSSGTWLTAVIIYLEIRNRFFANEYKEFNRKRVWTGLIIFGGLWLAGLGWFYIKTIGQFPSA
ncbi:MAG TPA: phosphatase PAP2 family protein [Patescibacteria group bacterium]